MSLLWCAFVAFYIKGYLLSSFMMIDNVDVDNDDDDDDDDDDDCSG